MTIEALIEAAPPPADPINAFAGDWDPVEALFGTALPEDYKDFARLYGAGDVLEVIRVHVPGSPEIEMNLSWMARDIPAGLRELGYPEAMFWPAPGGLIPFGHTDYVDFLFWRPVGAPDSWEVVIWGRSLQEFETVGCGLTDFLAGLATGRLQTRNLPSDLDSCVPFQPHSREDLERGSD